MHEHVIVTGVTLAVQQFVIDCCQFLCHVCLQIAKSWKCKLSCSFSHWMYTFKMTDFFTSETIRDKFHACLNFTLG